MHWATALALPGSAMSSLLPHTTSSALLSQASGVCWLLSARNMSASPVADRSATLARAWGVRSADPNPVPPVHKTRSVDSSASVCKRPASASGSSAMIWASSTSAPRARKRSTSSGPARLDNIRAAVITLSDRASRGEYADKSGPLLVERLRALGADVNDAQIMADDPDALAGRLQTLADEVTDLVLCTGRTGVGPADRP